MHFRGWSEKRRGIDAWNQARGTKAGKHYSNRILLKARREEKNRKAIEEKSADAVKVFKGGENLIEMQLETAPNEAKRRQRGEVLLKTKELKIKSTLMKR